MHATINVVVQRGGRKVVLGVNDEREGTGRSREEVGAAGADRGDELQLDVLALDRGGVGSSDHQQSGGAVVDVVEAGSGEIAAEDRGEVEALEGRHGRLDLDREIDDVRGEVFDSGDQLQGDWLVVAADRGGGWASPLAGVVGLDLAGGGAAISSESVPMVAGEDIQEPVSADLLANSSGVRGVSNVAVAAVANGKTDVEQAGVARTAGTCDASTQIAGQAVVVSGSIAGLAGVVAVRALTGCWIDVLLRGTGTGGTGEDERGVTALAVGIAAAGAGCACDVAGKTKSHPRRQVQTGRADADGTANHHRGMTC